MRAALLSLVSIVTAACGVETTLDGELLPDGYIRYTAPAVRLQPGETAQYVQWVAAPIDHDLDLVDVRGSQSAGGHHALLYASPDVEPIGTTREWQPADQISARFLGGAGGEGTTAVTALPPGAVLRVPAGSGFYIQTHYLNASDDVLEGISTIDMKVADPSPGATVLSMFVSSTLAIDVPNGPSEQAISCDVQEDTQLVIYFNHIHETGVAVSTQLRDANGVHMIKDDPAWNHEWTTRPNFDVTTLEAPLVVPAGSTLETRCNWDNPTERRLSFPDEMCAFLGFYVGDHDLACANGRWVEL